VTDNIRKREGAARRRAEKRKAESDAAALAAAEAAEAEKPAGRKKRVKTQARIAGEEEEEEEDLEVTRNINDTSSVRGDNVDVAGSSSIASTNNPNLHSSSHAREKHNETEVIRYLVLVFYLLKLFIVCFCSP
jgi:hypothetical protein